MKSTLGKISRIILIIIVFSLIINIVRAQNETQTLENALNSSVENETINESIEFNKTIEVPLENETSESPALIDISLEYPERITRGEEFSLKAF
ncbi:MAG: hypothetical protein QXK49_04000, partial [Candidatus Aenigmatarchaeota archaeon]